MPWRQIGLMAASDTRLTGEVLRMPVGQVAASTLRRCFDTVWLELRAAVASPTEAEHVHQLRVATRRALAAIDAFRPVIPANQRSWFEKRLRRLRRAAGEARDLDVLAVRLGGSDMATARGRLVEMLAGKRHDSQAPIRDELDDLMAADWSARMERLLADVNGRRRKSRFRAYARRRFKPMVDDFFKKSDRSLHEDDEIHALRIEGKKLRYALEIFGAVLSTRDRMRCQESLERLQKTLGDFTDHASAADRLTRWARETDAGSNREMLAALRDDESEQAARARKSLCRWWNPARRRSLRRRFRRTLRHSA
ncbi:MAG: CHAD domain-containing protein [Planctomycetia bacterium]